MLGVKPRQKCFFKTVFGEFRAIFWGEIWECHDHQVNQKRESRSHEEEKKEEWLSQLTKKVFSQNLTQTPGKRTNSSGIKICFLSPRVTEGEIVGWRFLGGCTHIKEFPLWKKTNAVRMRLQVIDGSFSQITKKRLEKFVRKMHPC